MAIYLDIASFKRLGLGFPPDIHDAVKADARIYLSIARLKLFMDNVIENYPIPT